MRQPDRKKTGGRGTGLSHTHMSCEKTCNMQHRAKKRAKTMQNHAMQNHAKTMQKTSCSTCCKKQAVPHVMQKPCKNHATCAYAGVYTGQVARQGGYAGRRGNPLNIHSPRVPCYMCYMCYISQGKPLNIHSPRVPCYMCYMCYMALYSIYSTDFARTEYIAHIVHIARSWGRVEVPRLGV